MGTTNFNIQRDIFKKIHANPRVQVIHESQLTPAIFDEFLATVVNNIVGLAPAYGSKCALIRLAISSPSNVLVVCLSSKRKMSRRSKKGGTASSGRHLLSQRILCGLSLEKYAFKMDQLASALYSDLDARITSAIDLLSLSRRARDTFEAILDALGGRTAIYKPAVEKIFRQDEYASAPVETTAALAWMACISASHLHMDRQLATLLIDTSEMDRTVSEVPL